MIARSEIAIFRIQNRGKKHRLRFDEVCFPLMSNGHIETFGMKIFIPIIIIIKTILRDIGMMVRVFANGPGDLVSIPGRVIPKTRKMVLDASLLNTQHYNGKDYE